MTNRSPKIEQSKAEAKTAASNVHRRDRHSCSFRRAAIHGSELHAEGHLNLLRAADSLVDAA
jgi:hypothetical protein